MTIRSGSAVLFAIVLLAGCGDSARQTTTPAGEGLSGRVSDASGAPLAGVMVTAIDTARSQSVSVYTSGSGAYRFPQLDSATYRVEAQRIGYRSQAESVSLARDAVRTDFSLETKRDVTDQLPASYFYDLLEWPNAGVRGDFSRACANCHQIGNSMWRKDRSEAEWQELIDRMIGYGGVPFFDETRPHLLPVILAAFGPDAPAPTFEPPPPPSGDAARVVIREWELDPELKPGCHDLELAEDGRVFTVGGMYSLDPATGERGHHPIQGGGHSVERAPDGSMWITAPGPEELIRFDVETGETQHYRQPRIGDDLGSYPHTLRFDDSGRIWYSLTRSNHVASFDPANAEFTYYRLPDADPAVAGVPIPVAYGCDVAPDQSVWFSQLFGHQIGRIDPDTGEIRFWQPPFDGPRRLRVGPDNIVWVPGYGASVLGRFDPKTETWQMYPLPAQTGKGELPYAIAVNHDTGDVWITGSNSDTLIRFRPSTEEFTSFHLPTPVDFTREIEFDDDGNIWTCTSSGEIADDRPGTGRLIQLQLLEREGTCGDGAIQLGEECDDANAAGCDGCSATCRIETGCGDGAVCGAETCDDGNRANCDGCSATCAPEPGFLCGDGQVNALCGEECDPSGDLCTRDCRLAPGCGDGVVDEGEECDDGNSTSCDGCSEGCTIETGCGDAIPCDAEACDDGNLFDCDGCDATCSIEPGGVCGDGLIDPLCGEECDPPGPGCSFSCTIGASIPLGTRRFTFGGTAHTSALGIGTPIGELEGAFELSAGAPGADGRAEVTLGDVSYYTAPILGGSFGRYCLRIDSCTGWIDCDGGSAVDVSVVQDSQGPGRQDQPAITTSGLGEDGGPGAVELHCVQAFAQIQPGEGDDCTVAAYAPVKGVIYTTGTTEAWFENAAPKIGEGAISASGENFACETWTREDGAGQLAVGFLEEDERQAGDIGNVNILDD